MRPRSRALAPLVVVFLAVGMSTALSFPFLSLFLTSAVHASPLELSFFLMAQPLSGIALSTGIGRLSDGRVGRRRLMLVCASAGCASELLFAVVRSYWPLLLLACTATAVAGAVMAQSFAYARAVFATDPSAAMVTSTLRVFFSLAWVVGPPLASLLLTTGGFATLYTCSAGLFAVILAVAVFWLTEPASSAPPTIETGDTPTMGVGPRRALWMTLAALVLLQSGLSLNVQALPLLVRQDLHGTVGAAGVLLGLCAAMEIPAMLGFGALSTLVPLTLLLRVGPLFGIAYYVIASTVGQVWQLGAAQLFNACFIAIVDGLAISYVQELLPGQPGRASTLSTNTFPTGAILASPLLGLGAAFGYRVSFVAATGLAAGGLLLLVAATRTGEGVAPGDVDRAQRVRSSA